MTIGTIRKILVTMSQIFKYGARHKYIIYNPYLEAEKPRDDQSEDIEAEGVEMRILNPQKLTHSSKQPRIKNTIRFSGLP